MTSRRETILKRVLRLVDISRDLDRNKSDFDFTNTGGEIVQVLDENIFEMFFRPFRHTEAVQTFYDTLWADEKHDSADWKSYEAQSALLTAEILIGKRPNERASAPLLMTEQHRYELAKRIEDLLVEIKVAVELNGKHIRRELAVKMAVLSDLERGAVDRTSVLAASLEARELGRDIKDLSAVAGRPDLDRFRVSRVAASFLADDQLAEPLEQLRRVVSHPIRSSLRTIQTAYPPTSADRASIEADAERWYERLVAELKAPAHRNRVRALIQQRREMTSEASTPHATSPDLGAAIEIRNDARSLAYLRWVVRNRLSPEHRLVFVTGDPVVFDAYRRWYLERESASRDGPEPFFLRRASQYSPMFNPVDSGSDLGQVENEQSEDSPLFTLIQQAVEASLLPLPFTDDRRGPDTVDPCFNASRERLALKLVDREDLTNDEELAALSHLLTDEWLAERDGEFSRITANWQSAHRFSIGASFETLSQRVGTELRETAKKYFSSDAREARFILRKYVTDVFDKLIDESLQLWLPIAETFDEVEHDAWRSRWGRRAKRVTVALEPSLRSRSAKAQPEAVFAAAAARALERQDVASGLRFATLAGRADRVANSRGVATVGHHLEFQYLQAVAFKLQIPSIDVHLRKSRVPLRRRSFVRRGSELVKTLHGRASSLIEHCIASHATAMDDAEADERDETGILLLRALSERASLNLFTATSFGLASQVEPSPMLDDPNRYLAVARGDLKRGLALDAALPEAAPILDDVRMQLIPNIAGYEVLAHLLNIDTPPELQTWSRRDLRRLSALQGSDNHPLLRAELEAFALLTDQKPRPEPSYAARSSHLDQMRSLILPLDRALYRRIYRDILLPSSQAPSTD